MPRHISSLPPHLRRRRLRTLASDPSRQRKADQPDSDEEILGLVLPRRRGHPAPKRDEKKEEHKRLDLPKPERPKPCPPPPPAPPTPPIPFSGPTFPRVRLVRRRRPGEREEEEEEEEENATCAALDQYVRARDVIACGPHCVTIGPFYCGRTRGGGGGDGEGATPDPDVMRRARGRFKAVRSRVGLDGDDDLDNFLVSSCRRLIRLLSDPSSASKIADSETVARDLLLLGNQVPFHLIQHIADIDGLSPASGESTTISLVDLCLSFFSANLSSFGGRTLLPVDASGLRHLLHLFHISVSPASSHHHPPSSQPTNVETPASEWIPSASELQEAGISIKPKTKANGGRPTNTSFLDVTFDNGTLRIPPLHITLHTHSILKTLITFELAAHPRTTAHVSAYARFMHQLVRTRDDMRLLLSKRVIIDGTNSVDEETTLFFFNLLRGLQLPSGGDGGCYLRAVYGGVGEYSSRGRNRWKALLKRTYKRNPWLACTVFVTALMLLLTALQTFFAVYAYFRPPASTTKS